jgi:hypothetical protein
MSSVHSLPENLDEQQMRAPTAARTRQENVATSTVHGNFTEAHRRVLEKLDSVQSTVDFVKISGSPFTGHLNKAGKPQASFVKFLINLKQVAIKAVHGCPAPTDAATNVTAILTELRPAEQPPQFITIFNEFIFEILTGVCDDEALNIVLRYEYSDDVFQTVKKDGRRALFALMQTYAPVSTNAGNNAKEKLERVRFSQDKNTIQDQITELYVLVQQYEAARASRLEPAEMWSFVTSAVKGSCWATFKLIMSTQQEFKTKKVFWFIDQVREYVLAIEDEDEASPSTSHSRGREKSVLNSAKACEESTSTSELIATVNRLAATVAAITTSKETSARVNNGRPYVKRSYDERPYDSSRMGACRFCGGKGHRHRDCPTLKTTLPKPPIPPRAGAVRAACNDDTPGFLMGVAAIEDESCSTRTSSFISVMAVLTMLFWFVATLVTVYSRNHVSFQHNLHCATTRHGSLAAANDTYCGFGVDSCASHHICDDQTKFSSIDFTRTKTFEVVHGEQITSSGVGSVTLNVATTSGIIKEVVLTDVHYMPQQRMCLISVGRAMTSQGFGSPDFKNLTWEADGNCTLKMIKTNGTFQLDASVKFWKWTRSGIKVERQGAQH